MLSGAWPHRLAPNHNASVVGDMVEDIVQHIEMLLPVPTLVTSLMPAVMQALSGVLCHVTLLCGRLMRMVVVCSPSADTSSVSHCLFNCQGFHLG